MGTLSAKDRLARIEYLRHRDGDNCWLCGTPMTFGAEQPGKLKAHNVSLDHVVERRNGGRTVNQNLRLAHRGCNNNRDKRFAHTAGPLAPGNLPGYPHPRLPAQYKALPPEANPYDAWVESWARTSSVWLETQKLPGAVQPEESEDGAEPGT